MSILSTNQKAIFKMVLGSLDYWALTLLNTGLQLDFVRAWCDNMMYILGESCYWNSWKMVLWTLLTFGALNIQLDTLCVLFTDYISMMLPLTWEWWLDESKGAGSIAFTPLSFMLSDSCFYRKECSIGRLKLVIEDGDFECLKEDHTFI